MSRTYNEWTEEDIDKLKRGIIPENHPHHAACHIKAKQLGFTFHKAKIVDEKWTQKQIDQLRSGILPKGKSWNEAVKVAAFHNIDFENIYKAKPLTADEVKLVNNGVIPPHREKADVIKFAASELSTSVFKTKYSKKSLEAVKKGEKLYKEFIKSTDSLETVAKRYGMTKQNAHRLIQAFKVYYFDTNCVKECLSEK